MSAEAGKYLAVCQQKLAYLPALLRSEIIYWLEIGLTWMIWIFRPESSSVIQSMVYTHPQITFQAAITPNFNQLGKHLDAIEFKLDFNHG